MPDVSRRANRSRGFTLFEVLGAVTILAVVYSWLATSAMQGMRSEGLSKRRMEASLLIDDQLMLIETGLAVGTPPALGRAELELDDLFRLVVEVTPFDPTPYLGEEYPPEGTTSTLLAPPENADEAFLRIINLTVSWHEAGDEHAVRRTTLAYDGAAIAALFPDPEPLTEEDLANKFTNPDGSPNIEAMMESMDRTSNRGTADARRNYRESKAQ